MVLLLLSACHASPTDFTITLGGDIMLARAGTPIFWLNGQQVDPWRELVEGGTLINESQVPPDYFMANLESPMGSPALGPMDYNLCAPLSEIRLLQSAGIDLVSLANNHSADCSCGGVNETARQLATAGIAYVDTDLSPAWLDTAAGRLAVIAAQDVIGKLDEAQLLQAVRQASAVSDYLIVSMHWGNEYQAGPDERQQRLAKALADAGADLIWGHHPHVLQKMEWLPTADGRQVLVIYSLGNLLSDQWMLEDTRQTVLLRLSYAQMRLVQIEVIPLNLERENKALHLLKNSEGLLATLLPDGLTSLPVEIELND